MPTTHGGNMPDMPTNDDVMHAILDPLVDAVWTDDITIAKLLSTHTAATTAITRLITDGASCPTDLLRWLVDFTSHINHQHARLLGNESRAWTKTKTAIHAQYAPSCPAEHA